MKLQDDAAARYHKIMESPEFQDLKWAESIQQRMSENKLAPSGRPVCPVVRPHFITRRQYEAMSKAAENLYSAIDRIRALMATTPALLNRLEMLPAEKMLAAVNPGYPYLAVTSLLDTQLVNGTFRFVETDTYGPSGVVYHDALSDLFYEAAPVKQLRKKYKLGKVAGMKKLLHSLLAAYKVTGKKKFPRIAIVEFRPPFKNTPGPEHVMMAEFFRQAGYPTEVVTPDQLDYRNGQLCRGDFGIEIAYRMVSAQEFLVRFSLSHPLVRAYREGAVCMVNSFQTEMLQKKAIFGLLTDETVTAKFPAAEKKAIREHLPWTRVVQAARTTHHGEEVDLPDFIMKNREKLVLKPNDAAADLHSYNGAETTDAAWERALKTALRNPYVVQERVELPRAEFPVFQYGRLEMRTMEIEVHPHLYLGKLGGCSTEIRDATTSFSTLGGIAPTFILEGSGRS
ncbi:MAG: circularly permuted type 2 ATP-grasp protein [Bryobacteraceae bacterium]